MAMARTAGLTATEIAHATTIGVATGVVSHEASGEIAIAIAASTARSCSKAANATGIEIGIGIEIAGSFRELRTRHATGFARTSTITGRAGKAVVCPAIRTTTI